MNLGFTLQIRNKMEMLMKLRIDICHFSPEKSKLHYVAPGIKSNVVPVLSEIIDEKQLSDLKQLGLLLDMFCAKKRVRKHNPFSKN